MSKGFSTRVDPEKEFSDWFFKHYRRLQMASLSDDLLTGPQNPLEINLRIAREMPGCYWLAQVWPKVPNKKTLLTVYGRGRLQTLADLDALILRGPDGEDIRRWARDHADPAVACACC